MWRPCTSRRETWNGVETEVGSSRDCCAAWRCEPGHGCLAMDPAEQELFTELSGRCRVHQEDGGFQGAGPGEASVMPPGFGGSFEVL